MLRLQQHGRLCPTVTPSTSAVQQGNLALQGIPEQAVHQSQAAQGVARLQFQRCATKLLDKARQAVAVQPLGLLHQQLLSHLHRVRGSAGIVHTQVSICSWTSDNCVMATQDSLRLPYPLAYCVSR